MKVAVISRGSPDYLIDIVTDGIIRLIGRKNVCLDYNVRKPGGQYETFYQQFEGPEPFDIHDAEILVASTRSLKESLEWVCRTGKKKVAIVDGEDFEPVEDVYKSVKVYFKREYIIGRAYPGNVKPLPFGAIPERLPGDADITNPVFYQMIGSDFYRSLVVKALESMGFFMPSKRLDKNEYNRMLMSSLVGVSVRGRGWDTYRYWETLYFGTALLSQRLPILIPNDLIEDKEAVFFNDIDGMKQKLRIMLDNPEKTFQIGQSGRKACLERHLSTHRAKTVLEGVS